MSKKQETGLTLASMTKNDVPALLEQVKSQIKELKGNKESDARITGPLEMFGVISSIKDPEVLKGAYAFITKKCEAIDSYASVFEKENPGVKVNPAKVGGHTVKQWQDEILRQYREVTYEEKLNKLNQVKEKLEANLSEEAKLRASMADIADILGL